MNRSGAALFVALLVVLLGGMVTVLATMVAMSETRAGAAWRDQQFAATLAASALARSLESAASLHDTAVVGESVPLNDTLALTRLGDSLDLISVSARYRAGEDLSHRLARAIRDSAGVSLLRVYGSRGRYHPVP